MTTVSPQGDVGRSEPVPCLPDASTHVGVVVLGMHRSGTSAVAGLFHAAGLHVGNGTDVMPPTADNPLGYHERVSVVGENDRLLARVGATWERPPVVGALAPLRQDEASTVSRMLSALLAEDVTRPLVLKDPRIGVLLPVWKPVLTGVLEPVVALRHPLEVARSLFVRDGMPLPAGLALWEIYLTAIIDAYQGERLTLAPIDRLAAHADTRVELVKLVCERLEASRTTELDPDQARAAFDGSLHRQRALAEESATYLTARQRDLWDFLRGTPSSCERLDAPTELRRPSESALATAEHIWQLRGRLAELEAHEPHFQEISAALETTRGALEQATQRVQASTAELLERGQRITDLEREMVTVKHDAQRALRAEAERDMLQARAAEALEQLRTQARLRAEERKAAQSLTEDLRRGQDLWQSRAVELDEEIRAMRRSRTWRIGRALLMPFGALRRPRRSR